MKYAILRFYIPVIFGLLIGWLVPMEKLWHLIDKFIWIMLAIAVESLVFWVLGTVLNVLKSNQYVYYQWDDIQSALSYFNLYYEPTWGKQTLTLLDIVLDRNSAIFAEPPMYGFLLCVAYSFYRMKSNQKIGTKIIFIATILSTIGTTAIIYLMIFEVLAFGLEKKKSSTAEFLKFLFFVVVGIIAALVIFDLIESKLLTGSGSVRSDHLRVSLKLFQTTFPFGCGIGNTDAFRQLEIYKQGMSVGLPAFFAQGGVASVVIFLYPLIKLLIVSVKEKKHIVIAFIVAFLWTSTCTSVQFNSPLSWFIVCYAARGTSVFTHTVNNLQRNFTEKYPDGQVS